jgi:hypothetical protein
MSDYRGGKVQADDGAKGDELPPLPCKKCGAITSRSTLAIHGAQCYPCYAAYLRETPRYYRAGMPETPAVANMKTRLKTRTP